jgi:hypothetical protein
MVLTNKAAIESEYITKRDAIRAITPTAINTALAGLDGFVLQCDELVMVLKAREALNGRPADTGVAPEVSAKTQDLKNTAALVRALAAEIKVLVPD